MSKLKDFIKKQTKKTKIILGVGLLVVIGILFLSLYNGEAKVDTTYLIGQIKKSSELTTSKLNYKGITEFEDVGISILNKSNFLMVYHADARFGIDLEEVEVTANDTLKKVTIKIPKAKILDVKVDQKNIKYYDKKFSLFNFDSLEDANKAVAKAETEAMKDIAKLGVLEMADNQAETLIRGLVEPLVPDEYEIVVEVLEETK